MKKIIIAASFLIVGSIVGCKKEVIEKKDCNCGVILSDDVKDYSVVIKNNCSGNSKKFYLQPGDWMNAHPGNEQCLNDVASW